MNNTRQLGLCVLSAADVVWNDPSWSLRAEPNAAAEVLGHKGDDLLFYIRRRFRFRGTFGRG